MKKLLAALLVLGACAAPKPGEPAPARDQAVVFKTHNYVFSKTPDPDLETALPDLVAQSYDSACETLPDAPSEAGFSYTLAPKGAVYPFSEVEVACVIREKYASRYGEELCSAFFSALGKKIKSGLKNH
ncbi:MAG TPA: hypothetical protein DCL44_06160 [Elusimicrobia bacterium]|nr:hypothetical protein [Elusimicrobiota bacterium]